MKNSLRKPSPSMVVALIALFVAMSGTAVAAGTLAKNSVGSKQIKKNAVTSSKIKSSAVTGSKVKNGSLTGSDVNASTLGTVPSATNATNAGSATSAESVDGASFAKIRFQAPNGSAAQTVYSASGLTVTAQCLSPTNLELTAKTSKNDSIIHVSNANLTSSTNVANTDPNKDNTVLYAEDDNFDTADTLNMLPDGGLGANVADDSTNGTLVYAAPDGTQISILFAAEEASSGLGTTNDCFVLGTATAFG